MEQKISSLTYPRSGSHFLQFCINKSAGIDINRVHTLEQINDHDFVISVLRKPEECVPSIAAMNRRTYQISGYCMEEEASLPYNVKQSTEYFVKFYSEIINRANLIIKFEDLVNNTDSTIKYICDLLNLNHTAIPNNIAELYDKYAEVKFQSSIIRTSTTLVDYEESKEIFQTLNNDLIKNCYLNILGKCAII